MLIFLVLLLVPMLVQHAVAGRKLVDFEKKNRWAMFLFFMGLAFLLMFRHETVGTDTRNYIVYFNYFLKLDWAEVGKWGLEAGFSYYNKIISLISQEPRFFLVVTSIVTVALIYPTYKRLCLDPSLTIVLFCTMSTFVMMFSGLRQILAVCLGVVAYEFTRNKKLIPFILTVILAMMFHTSAFMLGFMYPLYHAKITRKWLFVVVPAMIIVFIFNEQIFTSLIFLLAQYTEYDGTITQTGAYTMIILFVVFAVFAFVIPDEKLLDKEAIGLRNFLLFSVVLQMFAPLHTIAMRMNYYYIIFIPLLLPKIIEYRSKRWEQVAVAGRHVMVVFFFLYFFLSAQGDGNLHVFPYHFFWETVS